MGWQLVPLAAMLVLLAVGYGAVVVPFISWSSAGVYMAGVLGVSVLDYAPWAVFCYVGFAFALVLGYSGIGIAKRR